MKNPETELLPLLNKSLRTAIKTEDCWTNDLRRRNAQRSRNWVQSLGRAFRDSYSEEFKSVRVLWKTSEEGDSCCREFGLSEMLYDITVVMTEQIRVSGRTEPVRYVSRPLWSVESEFSRNPVEAVKDFNKLVLSAAPELLFIASDTIDRETLKAVAAACSGRVWIALVKHPSEWKQEMAERTDLVSLCLLQKGEWIPVRV